MILSLFRTLMTDSVIPALTGYFGDSATYYVADTDATVSVDAILSENVAVPNQLSGATEYQTQIEIPSSQLTGIKPRRGDVITIDSVRWIVLTRLTDDGYLSRITVRRGDD